MNILFTCRYPFNPNAGAAGVTWRLGQEYRQLGHGVAFYFVDHLPRCFHPLAKFITFPVFVFRYLLRQTELNAVDVIDASTGDTWLWSILLQSRISRILPRLLQKISNSHLNSPSKPLSPLLTGSPLLVVRCHGLEHLEHLMSRQEAQRGHLHLGWKYPLYRGSFRLWEVAYSMQQADLVLFLNQTDRAYALTHFHLDPDRSAVVANGITAVFLNRPFEPTPAPGAPLRIAQISSYIPRKGIQYGSPALNTLLHRHPEVCLSFLGTEVPAETVYADFDISLHDRITVIPTYENDQLPDLLQGHQIKFLPTLSEGFGVALLEAMACGLAPISTRTPGPTEIIQSGQNGLLVPESDRVSLEQSLERLIRDRAFLDRLRQNAYATAQQYDWGTIGQTQLHLYQQALARR